MQHQLILNGINIKTKKLKIYTQPYTFCVAVFFYPSQLTIQYSQFTKKAIFAKK